LWKGCGHPETIVNHCQQKNFQKAGIPSAVIDTVVSTPFKIALLNFTIDRKLF